MISDEFTNYHNDEQPDSKGKGVSKSQFISLLKPETVERTTQPPSYMFSLTDAGLLVSPPISRPYSLRPQAKHPIRRTPSKAKGRPSPLVLHARSRPRPKTPRLSSPHPHSTPIKLLRAAGGTPTAQHHDHSLELSPKYTLEVDLSLKGQSHLMSSPQMQGLVTKSYADLKAKRGVSRRKSNISLRSPPSDRYKSTFYGKVYSNEAVPPIPILPRNLDLNFDRSPNVADQTNLTPLTMSTSNSSASISSVAHPPLSPVSPMINRTKESRYLRNAPPPLQLKGFSHSPRSRRVSRRISRETRSSMQSFDSSIFPLSPLTARPKMPSKKEQQRRRLMKLKRTLGEDVPLELIATPPSFGFSALGMRDLGSLDSNTLSEFTPVFHSPSASPTTPRGQKRGPFTAMRRRNRPTAAHRPPAAVLPPIRVSVDKEVDVSGKPSHHPQPHRLPSPPVILISAHPYSNIRNIPEVALFEDDDSDGDVEEVRDLSASSVPRYEETSTSTSTSTGIQRRDRTSFGSVRSHWPRTPFAHAFEPVPEATYLAPPLPPSFIGGATNGLGTTSAIKRSERRQGWSGEWNQGDIQDVIAKLRNM